MKELVIDGAKFSDIESFYDEIEQVLTKGLDWQMGHNLDAFNDILYGGFGAFDCDEPIQLVWKRFSKSKRDLGVDASVSYYQQRAAKLDGPRSAYFRNKATELEQGSGQSLIETILEIISSHERVTLLTEDGK